MVAYYPDRETSLDVARALLDGGTTYLEIQFPFSDPTADGLYIQNACSRALNRGFTLSRGFKLVEDICGLSKTPVFIMCYANTVFFGGVENFLRRCRDAGAVGLIVPDLPVDYDEQLFETAAARGLHAVPVVSPTVTERRLQSIMAIKPVYIYAALRKGITGKTTIIGNDNVDFLANIRKLAPDEGVMILAGFGISSRDQLQLLASHVDASIIGSALVRVIMESDPGKVYEAVKAKMEELLG
jgi:tryptophan synthase alpha chain